MQQNDMSAHGPAAGAVVLLQPTLPLVGGSTGQERGCQQNDSASMSYPAPAGWDRQTSLRRIHASPSTLSRRFRFPFPYQTGRGEGKGGMGGD